MIISDLNYLENAEIAEVIGGFTSGGGSYKFSTKYRSEIKSEVCLTPATHSAVGDAVASAAPYSLGGASTTGMEVTLLAGLPAGDASRTFYVGSLTAIRGYAAAAG